MYEFKNFRILITLFLVLLFAYTSVDKLMNAQTFRETLVQHPIPAGAVPVLLWTVPASEMLIAMLLAFPVTRRFGLLSALFILVAFTSYLTVVLSGSLGTVPCGCGGVFESMDWYEHILLNAVLLASILWALYGHRIIQATKASKN